VELVVEVLVDFLQLLELLALLIQVVVVVAVGQPPQAQAVQDL
jgi:hypothetical protein